MEIYKYTYIYALDHIEVDACVNNVMYDITYIIHMSVYLFTLLIIFYVSYTVKISDCLEWPRA